MSHSPEFVSWEQLFNWVESYHPDARKRLILKSVNHHAEIVGLLRETMDYLEYGKMHNKIQSTLSRLDGKAEGK